MRHLLVFLCLSPWAFSQDTDLKDLMDMDLEELLSMKITVASGESGKGATIRESPAILSVITEADIRNWGARDLIDIFRMIPGFFFGVDVQGIVGLGIRGNWGHEGKILLIVDGQEQNELQYSTLQLGNHYPVDQIKTIEIIRGPGSAIYGGNAELAVIKITSKAGTDLKGVAGSLRLGRMQHSSGASQAQIAYGDQINDWDFSLSGYLSDGRRSDAVYTDIFGDSYSLKDNADLDSSFVNIGIKKNHFEGRFIWDGFEATTRDLYDESLSEPSGISFTSTFVGLKYQWKLNDRLSLVPKINYREHTPWRQDDRVAIENGLKYDSVTERLTLNLQLLAELSEKWDLVFGLERYEEESDLPTFDELGLETERTSPSFSNTAGFAQVTGKYQHLSITLGARAENHSAVGSTFVPRIGLTGIFADFHFKALYSEAFRAPNVQNLELNPNIVPEETQVLELELGYRLSETSFIVVNLFDVQIDQPIVYFFDEGDQYENFPTVGTRGLEAEWRLKLKRANLGVNLSHYQAHNNQVSEYQVADQDKALLGAPQEKINAWLSLPLWRSLKLNSQLSHTSSRWAYTHLDADEEESQLEKLQALTQLNLNFVYGFNLVGKQCDLQIGVFDLLKETEYYAQPYNSWHAPYPGPTREFYIKLQLH